MFVSLFRPLQMRPLRIRHGLLAALMAVSGLACAANGEAGLQWFDAGRPRNTAWTAVDLLLKAPDDGLDADDYDAGGLRQVLTALEGGTSLPEADLASLDGALTNALQRFLSDLHFGRLPPKAVRENGGAASLDRFDPAAILRAALAANRLADVVTDAAPAQLPYTSLREALRRYRELADDPTRSKAWKTPLPALAARKLEPGQPWAGVPLLAARLAALGDMPATTAGARYDGAVVEGVKAFQARHGLLADGVIGRDTLAQLAVSPAERVRQIGVNLERLRWTPQQRAARMIVVNVPEFALRGYAQEDGQPKAKVQMKVIVGKSLDTRTPLFAEDMRFIEFSPYWNVPPSIAQAELVPRLRRDPAHFTDQGFEFVAGDGRVLTTLSDENLEAVMRGQMRIRQRPGPKNALGDIKFVFPNNDNIYLHHTPSTQLFARARRDLSHGCIRVEAPVELAKFVLQDQLDWSETRIREAMERGKSATLRLKEPLPVVITYRTAVAKGGKVYFFPDIYGRDAQLDEALRKVAGPLRPVRRPTEGAAGQRRPAA